MKRNDTIIKKFNGFINESNIGYTIYAHKYKLHVRWSKRPDWNITILSVNTSNINAWIPTTENEDDHIVNMNIELLERNAERVDSGFVAKGID